MRIVVVSDTHGRNETFLHAVEYEDFDMVFHLGDYVEDGEYIGESLGIPTLIVRGNGDFDPNYRDDELVEIGGKRIFLTHGHLYNIRSGLDSLYYAGLEEEADLVLFGHSHVAVNIKDGNMIIMNPGSPSFPRLNPSHMGTTAGRRFTYGIIDIDDDIKTEIVEIE